MQNDRAGVVGVQRMRLEKRDENGQLFEVVECGADGEPSRVLLRKPGQPASSYARLPFEGKDAP